VYYSREPGPARGERGAAGLREGFLERRRVLESSWERMKRQLQEFYVTAAEKTDEMARVGARKIDILALRRRLSGELGALGTRVYEMLEKEKSETVAADPDVVRLVAAARELEREIGEREREIEGIRAAAEEKRYRDRGRE
jgi:hypothetical protein